MLKDKCCYTCFPECRKGGEKSKKKNDGRAGYSTISGFLTNIPDLQTDSVRVEYRKE